MIETIWIIIPNLIASYMVMVNKAFYANMIYCFGYLLFILHNYNSGDSSQMIYFTILEIMSIVGVFLYIYIPLKKRLELMKRKIAITRGLRFKSKIPKIRMNFHHLILGEKPNVKAIAWAAGKIVN